MRRTRQSNRRRLRAMPTTASQTSATSNASDDDLAKELDQLGQIHEEPDEQQDREQGP